MALARSGYMPMVANRMSTRPVTSAGITFGDRRREELDRHADELAEQASDIGVEAVLFPFEVTTPRAGCHLGCR